jgi:hypothetical protein
LTKMHGAWRIWSMARSLAFPTEKWGGACRAGGAIAQGVWSTTEHFLPKNRELIAAPYSSVDNVRLCSMA